MLRRSVRGRRLWPTPAVRRRTERLRAEWLEHAMTTAPADRPAAEEAIGELYGLAGLATPRFVWVESPAAALLAEWLLSGGRHGFDDDLLKLPYERVLADPMWDDIGSGLRDSVWAALRQALGDRLDATAPRRSLLTDSSEPTAGANELTHLTYRPSLAREARIFYSRLWVYGAERALAELAERRTLTSPPRRVSGATAGRLTRLLAFPGDTWKLLGTALKEALSVPAGNWPGPPRRGLWLALTHHLLTTIPTMSDRYLKQADLTGIPADLAYRELGAVPGLRPEHSRRLDLHAQVARSSGPWWPFHGVCIMIERPARLHVEPDRGLLRPHRDDGPALADGFALHAWHGVSVPARYTTGQATVDDWRTEANLERRRLLAERIGYARLLEATHAQRIATDEFGTLWRIPTPAAVEEDLVVVDVLNSTPDPDGTRRRYVLRVPPDQTVPRDAIGWTFGLPPGTYHPTQMT